MTSNGTKRSTAATTARVLMTACTALVASAAASAHDTSLSIVTKENPAQPGAFTLDFGGPGLTSSSNITSTTYELNVDPILGTASFVSYVQHVDPLILPGGFSTGAMTVQVVDGSSAGTFDPLTRTFSTNEFYAIHFTGDLSAFGLTSPVFLPGASTGEVVLDAAKGGEVKMDWDGVGQLANPFDPTTPLNFTYRCEVNTLFPATPDKVLSLDLTPDVASLNLPTGVERRLTIRLDQALTRFQNGNPTGAVLALKAFVNLVTLLRGWVIVDADADELIADARATIDLIRLGYVPGGR